MIDVMNTPFDHIDRILLQDFSGSDREDGEKLLDIEGEENYFKKLFNFNFSFGTYGITTFRMSDPETGENYTPVEYDAVNSRFARAGAESGGFFLDSFTYTPFIDYATVDPKIGVYSDEFLTDYNCGRYEESYEGNDKKT